MGLRNLTFPEVTVEIPGGGKFAVRGLSPDMVLGLYNRHRGDLSTLFDTYVAQQRGIETADMGSLIGEMVTTAPVVMAELIALAAGGTPKADHVEPDTENNPHGLTDWERDVANAHRLPLPVQIDALQKIAAQTFTSDMPLGKFLAVVGKAAATATATLQPLTS